MTQTPLVDLPGSKLFYQLLRDPSGLLRMDVDAGLAQRRAAAIPDRTAITEVIRTSMRSVTLSSAQQAALDRLMDPKSVVVTTGQQVGALGGPLYTLLKIGSMVQCARELADQVGQPTVPVFWLEDNDHDADEAATAVLPGTDGQGVDHLRHWDGTDERQPVSRRSFDAAQLQVVSEMLDRLDGREADAERERLRAIYVDGASWSEAFLHVLQPYLAHWGVVVLHASELIASRLHQPILVHLLREASPLHRALEQSTRTIVDAGFHAQAEIPEVPFFVLDEQGRQRIERSGDQVNVGGRSMTFSDLVDLAEREPERFTPTVMTRSILQDAVLPTVAAILGPGEIAYSVQLTGAYEIAGIERPAILNRHHACLLDARTERNLLKVEHPVSWYYRTLDQIEHDLNAERAQQALPIIPDVQEMMTPWVEAAQRIDPTLVKTAGATGAQIEAAFQALSAKLSNALKRQDQAATDRHRAIWWSVYPSATLSERVYPMSLWVSRIGSDALRIIVETVCQQPRTSLTTIGVSDVDSK